MSNDLGIDRSGNGNNFTVNNLAYSDQMVDSPTNNFATLNPLHLPVTTPPTFAEGNLEVTTPVNGAGVCVSTIGATSGKWYAEFYIKSSTGAMRASAAVTSDANATIYANTNIGSLSGARDVGYMGNDGEKFVSGSESSYGDAFSNGDIIGIVLDVDNNTVNFYHNNVAKGNITMASTGTYHFAYGDVSAGVGSVMVANFGQDSSFAGNKTAQGNQDGNDIGDFYYTPPTGFLALCTSNLPDVAVVPSEHFNTVLYTANDDTLNVTGVGFQSDFSWFKIRSGTGSHALFDAIRGVNKGLSTNQTAGEYTAAADADLVSWNSDGFTLGAGEDWASVNDTDNASIVVWNWKANGSGSSNTDGSINTTKTSANVNAGFSIVSYTGNGSANQTVGHGLSQDIDMVIVKNRTSGSNDNWRVWHTGLSGNTYYVGLNQTSAQDTSSTVFNGHSATTFTVGNDGSVNRNTDTYIAYAFHSVDGYSKVGSYTGNSNANGTFVYTGFRPAFILVKSSTEVRNWHNMDSTRDSYNVATKIVWANKSNEEYTDAAYTSLDFVSNGFKIRNNDTAMNNNGQTHIYIAFAETPFKYSNAR